jgi:hypothetical protein
MKLLRLLLRVDVAALFGLVLLGLYFWGTLAVNREGARAVEIDKLRARILAFVKQHQGPGPVFLQDLQQAGIVSDHDLEFLRKNDLSYHPISAQSPDNALYFVARRGHTESRYYKGGRMDYVATWPSPEQSYAVVSAPNPRDPSQRIVAVVEQATQRVLGTLETPATGVLADEALWSPDQHYVAINVPVHKRGTAANFIECSCVFEVTPNGARTIPLPDQLQPGALLDPADVARGVQWHDHWIRATSWRDGSTLLVESEGRGRIGNPAQRPAQSFNLSFRFEVRLQDGAATIMKKTQKHFVKSVSK